MPKLDINRVKNLYWNKNYNAREIAKRFDVSIWALYDFMSKNSIVRRSYSESGP